MSKLHEKNQSEEIRNERGNSLARGIVIGLGIAFLVVVIFSVGMFIGAKKVMFSYRWGENYHQFFGGPRFGREKPPFFFGGYGTFGEVIKKGKKQLVLRGRDDKEKIIEAKKDIVIVKGNQRIEFSEIKVKDSIVVIGEPGSKGQIEARMIRVFPPLPLEDSWYWQPRRGGV